MTGEEFAAIRKRFGLKKADWMYALGYSGVKNTLYLNCDRYENGTRDIPLYLAQYVWLVDRVAMPGDIPKSTDGMPLWPVWDKYDGPAPLPGNDPVIRPGDPLL